MRNLLRVAIAVVVAVVLAIGVGLLFSGFSDAVTPLDSAVRSVLTYAVPKADNGGMESGGLDLIEDGWSCGPGCEGTKVSFFGVLLGGIPLALTAFVLARRERQRQWSRRWGHLFQAGFIFNLGSLILSGGLLALLAAIFVSMVSDSPEAGVWTIDLATLLIVVFLLADCCCSAMALRWWRRLLTPFSDQPDFNR